MNNQPFFSVRYISSRSDPNLLAIVACCTGTKLKDWDTSEQFDYSYLNVCHQQVVAPLNMPSWIHKHEDLWNRARARENRHDAQLARYVSFSLPCSLPQEEQIHLCETFINGQFIALGMIGSYGIHSPQELEANVVHLLLTLRPPDNVGWAEDERIWGDKKREWNTRGQLIKWRRVWRQDLIESCEQLGPGKTIEESMPPAAVLPVFEQPPGESEVVSAEHLEALARAATFPSGRYNIGAVLVSRLRHRIEYRPAADWLGRARQEASLPRGLALKVIRAMDKYDPDKEFIVVFLEQQRIEVRPLQQKE